MRVNDNLKQIESAIKEACTKANRKPEEITLIAVTKYVSAERAQEALEAGIVHLGENRDEGLLAKWDVLKDKPTWHFIGTLQTRKVKNIIDKVDYIHSLDRLSLAKEIDKRADRKINCFVQVNVSGEESKQGINPEEVADFISCLADYKNLNVIGLMTMAPLSDDEELLRSCFRKLKNLQTMVKDLGFDFAPCTELSMGMSNDFSLAIEEGATMVRIGTALVGQKSQEV
ncbi:YggS family pyridoxal phosphate-dependent enzyme [Cytobacillus oceanisediminis]|uniref:Pyridoxal phosphate homeostasis protein n=1 Tax=Cytobacillus oceanisediminis 2691 TaxID=1196031 RepID=A0A160M9D5_9BACI|nr:YggS family pyridoxal phosphate-dependent enzyme [Cytobacillus oceanisediminis]AND39306.1 YggS family pyridoxal phosphate enzyme [Cytobacillus oceanisediminis 2691]